MLGVVSEHSYSASQSNFLSTARAPHPTPHPSPLGVVLEMPPPALSQLAWAHSKAVGVSRPTGAPTLRILTSLISCTLESKLLHIKVRLGADIQNLEGARVR
jgi:hypothetical protein